MNNSGGLFHVQTLEVSHDRTSTTAPRRQRLRQGAVKARSSPPSACQCPRCRLTALYGRILQAAVDIPAPFDDRLAEIAVEFSELLLGGSSPWCRELQGIFQSIEGEAIAAGGTDAGQRLRAIGERLKLYIEKGN